jgi:NAD(P)-dependent dehydrogenase (short-subunit alcohol dehydrogenase family)
MTDATYSMIGKTCLVTGANAGIGKATALGLAQMGASVVLVCRDPGRGQAALSEIQHQSGNPSVSLLLADLSSQTSIRQLAAEFKSSYPALHVLINNAGVIPKKHTFTEDGLETQFAVNHLAYFLLTYLLLDQLKSSASARIVNVSSQAHRRSVSLDFNDLQSTRSYHRSQVYARTKLANVLFTYELARRLEGTQVAANCLHPGVIATNLLGDYAGMPRVLRFFTNLLGASPEQGAHTSLYLATSPQVEGSSGQYFIDCKAVPSSTESYDEQTAERLWQVSAELTGLDE